MEVGNKEQTNVHRQSYPLRKVHWRVPKLMAKAREMSKKRSPADVRTGTEMEFSTPLNAIKTVSTNIVDNTGIRSAKSKLRSTVIRTGKENLLNEPFSMGNENLDESHNESSSSLNSIQTLRKNMMAQVGVTPARTRAKNHLQHMLMHAPKDEEKVTTITSNPARPRSRIRGRNKQIYTKYEANSNSSTEDIRQMLDISSIAESPIGAVNENEHFESVNDDTHCLDFENETSTCPDIDEDVRYSFETEKKSNEILVDLHPSYGKLLYDFGFKRLYLACGKTLCDSVPIWHLQRPCDKLRVLRIAECKKDNSSFPGVISIFDFERSSASIEIPQVCGVFDGQHRLLAINEIVKQQPDKKVQVLVEVFPVETQADVKRWFLEINKAEMVQEIDLPDKIAPENRRIIDEVCDSLRDQFPEIVTTNNRCRPPNLCIDRFRNRLFQENVLEKCSILTEEDLYSLIVQVNEKFSQRKHSQWPSKVHRNLKKAKRCKFFLGLTDEWLDEMLDNNSKANQ